MIGTHNSYTYLPARNKIFELFSFLWRTQVKDIREQKVMGVTYFDIRVRKHPTRESWIVCHGIVDLTLEFFNLEEIAILFSNYNIRLILERGGFNERINFTKQANKILKFPNVKFIGIKKGWYIIYEDKSLNFIDYTYTPWLSGLSFWENIKRFNFFSTIKRWAKKHNPIINNDIKKDNTIYFMDYV